MEFLITLLENYGWHILIFLLGFIVLFCKILSPLIIKYKKRKAEDEYAAKYHKDPSLLAARMAAQEAAVRKLQEKYDKDAEIYNQKIKRKEEKQREELFQKFSGEGHRLGSKETLKSEYNPLMGSSGPSHRFKKKKTCSGGGCGN